MPKTLPELPVKARSEATDWLNRHRDEIPASVALAIDLSLKIAASMADKRASGRALLLQLRRALGIISSSERRRSSGKPLAGAPKKAKQDRLEKIAALRSDLNRTKTLGKWHRRLGSRHGRKGKILEGRLMVLEQTPIDDDDFSPEEEARLAQEDQECAERMAMGQRCDLDCAGVTETLMRGVAPDVQVEDVDCMVDQDSLPKGAVVKQQFFEERERINFSFTVTKLDIAVEKLSVETSAGTTLVAATLDQIGPPKSKVTWEFLANMSILVAQYAMPLNRFAGMASSSAKRFTSAEMCRHFHYVASRLAPIYLELQRMLADSDVLAGDDTGSRVIEVTKALKTVEDGQKLDMPWQDYATMAQAAAALKKSREPTLALKLAVALGFEFERKDGKGAKTGFNTTVLSGRSDPHDPRSLVVFFRSHFGGLGNLLDVVLARRRADNSRLVIQSDLSTVNLISDPALRQRLILNLAGCAYHARRPFALHEADDPELCLYILHEFKGIAIYEDGLRVNGKNRDNTAAIRDSEGRAIWENIKRYATLITQRWSKESPLGGGARYILDNFPVLTYYLGDHRVPPSNNFSERMIRPEKQIQDAALFRQTLEGRFALDIVRSVLQTAIAAHADLAGYLTWVMRMPPEVVDAAPEEFTPRAYVRYMSGQR